MARMVIRTSSHSTGFPSISGCHLLEKVPGTEFGCHGVTLREVNLRHPLYVRDGHAHKKISHPSKKNWWYLFLMQLYMKSIIILNILIIGGSKGGRQGRAPPWGSKFFHFHAVFGKKLKNNSIFGSWRPPLGKILDPPLLILQKQVQTSPVDHSNNSEMEARIIL